MSTSSTATASSAPVASRVELSWADYKPKVVPSEDAMSEGDVKVVWSNIMKFAGITAPSESQIKMVHLAVYAYLARNGTSRDGDYAGKITINDGRVIEAAHIKRAAGIGCRKFMRGCIEESYVALKTSKVMEEDQRFVAKAAVFGISPECAFAMADWMDDCHLFTPKEKQAHDAVKNHGLARSRGARGGMTLEEVEGKRVQDGLNAGAIGNRDEGPIVM